MFSSITFAPALVAVFTLREGHWPRPRPCSAAPPIKHYPGDTRPARCLPVKWSGGRNWLFPVKIFKYRNIFLCWLLLSTAHWNTSLRGGTNLISLNYNNTGEIFLKMRAEKWHNKLAKTCFKNHIQRFGLVQLTMLFNTYNFKACSGPRASNVSSTSTLFF